MIAFLILSYASNLNKSKKVAEQLNVIRQIYAYSGEEQGAYNKAYTDLRRKNKQLMTASVENNNTLELNKTYADKVSNYKIYGNSVNLFDINAVTKFIRGGNYSFTEVSSSDYSSISDSVITNNMGLYGNRVLCNSNITQLPAGTYTLSADVMADNSEVKDIYLEVMDKNYNRSYKHIQLSSYKTWERVSFTFTLSEKTEILGFGFQGGGTKDKYYNLNIKFKNIQLEKGSTATEYKPFEYGVGDKVNLFNPKGEIKSFDGVYWGLDITDMKITGYTLQIKLKAGKTIPEGVSFGYIYYATQSSNPQGIWLVEKGKLKENLGDGNTYGILTINKELDYKTGLVCYSNGGTTQKTWDSLMDAFEIYLVAGVYNVNTMPEYIPYNKNKIPIVVDGNREGENLLDVKKFEQGTVAAIDGRDYNQQNRARTNYIFLKAGDYVISSTGNVKCAGNLHKYRQANANSWLGTLTITRETSGDKTIGYVTLDEDCYIRVAFLPEDEIQIKNLSNTNIQDYNPQLKVIQASKKYDIYIDGALKSEEYIDFKTRKVVRTDGTTENVELPELETFEDYTKIEVLTELKPSKIEVEYTGYTLD